jgi:TonB family protein
VSQPSQAPAPAQAAGEAATSETSNGADASALAEGDAASAATADTARREREDRDRRERDRRERERRADEAAKKDDAAATAGDAAAVKPVASVPASGPKSVRVTVIYDEAGRVTQASVAGATPGAEAYGSTAVRIARGRRFAAGKAGSTVVTIPVN